LVQPVELFFGLAQLGLRSPCPGKEGSSGLSQYHTRWGPLEEPGMQLGFQAPHASGDRRLRHA